MARAGVLATSQVYWTQDVTRAIVTNGNQGLKDYVAVLNQQLDSVVILVRGSLTELQRATIGALVVINVHARDSIAQMILKGVKNDQDFEWIAQLRYYFEVLDGMRQECGRNGSSGSYCGRTRQVRVRIPWQHYVAGDYAADGSLLPYDDGSD